MASEGSEEEEEALRGYGAFEDDEADSTMELSLHDVFALSRADQQTKPAAPADTLLPHTRDGDDEETAKLRRADLLRPPGPLGGGDEGELTGELPFIEELDDEGLNEDTDPSMDLYDPILNAALLGASSPGASLDAPHHPATLPGDALELIHEEDEDEDTHSPEQWADSTSVFRPDPALLAAARGAIEEAAALRPTPQQPSMPQPQLRNVWGDPDEPMDDSATGHFEVPADLLSRLRDEAAQHAKTPAPQPYDDSVTGHFELPVELLSRLRDEAAQDAQRASALSRSPAETTALELEVVATVDDHGRLILPPEFIQSGPLQPGMRLKLKLSIL